MKRIYIFGDKGSSSCSLLQLIHSLNSNTNGYLIRRTCGKKLSSCFNLEDSKLICFGGGYDLGYLESLQESGCALLQRWIGGGGRYLGICAGAYFGSRYCAFDVGGPLEVQGPRLLGLFDVGPVYEGFAYNSESGSCVVEIETMDDNVTPKYSSVYFNGGCTFKSQTLENSQILYRYLDTKEPAIIKSAFNQGIAILSGVHFEYNPYLMELDSKYKSDIIEQLKAHESDRVKLMHYLLDLLLDS